MCLENTYYSSVSRFWISNMILLYFANSPRIEFPFGPLWKKKYGHPCPKMSWQKNPANKGKQTVSLQPSAEGKPLPTEFRDSKLLFTWIRPKDWVVYQNTHSELLLNVHKPCFSCFCTSTRFWPCCYRKVLWEGTESEKQWGRIYIKNGRDEKVFFCFVLVFRIKFMLLYCVCLQLLFLTPANRSAAKGREVIKKREGW